MEGSYIRRGFAREKEEHMEVSTLGGGVQMEGWHGTNGGHVR